MSNALPANEFKLWRSDQLFNIDFASYTLTHHHFSKHFHDHYVIELVVDGADSFYCSGKTYSAGKNQFAFINPGEVHTGNTVADTPLKYYSLYPGRKSMMEIATQLEIVLPDDLQFQRPVVSQPLLAEKFLTLFHSFCLSPEDKFFQEEIFFDCMYALLKRTNHDDPSSSANKQDRRVQLLIDYIRSHFQEEISLQQLASLVHLNPFHLLRVFKKIIGVSPYEYLLIIRSEHARQLLRSGYKVQDAALEAGFYDTSHFNRVFRKIAGMSPKSFRSSKCQYRTNFNG
ncbi:MAG: helix-turn-helix domain-containing protein [Chitinophagaceae bacterium]